MAVFENLGAFRRPQDLAPRVTHPRHPPLLTALFLSVVVTTRYQFLPVIEEHAYAILHWVHVWIAKN